ncbi:hypothetical protein [Microbacterium sp. TNHR37B]|uniref:hypothetical protein n=1 Tax=Microbacterium sp. TNHR37B TaxID=1775956 RepID=UPI0007B29A8B|nr:hypothetical protein [Microbacterium sp. TNHR37B]KZE90721.1 hypothetical protein AVP41_00240 [Microbacterium sp. TNHR37B]
MRLTRLRMTALLIALGSLVAGAGVAGSIGDTSAAWTDSTSASVVATGGSWVPASAIGCTAMNPNGTPKPGGRCSVTSIQLQGEWGNPGARTRGYSVVFNSNAGGGYIQFTIDLSTAGGPFSWATAGLVAPAQQAIPDNGWSCAQLPMLTAKTPTNWGWGQSSSIYFQVTEDRSSTGAVCG